MDHIMFTFIGLFCWNFLANCVLSFCSDLL